MGDENSCAESKSSPPEDYPLPGYPSLEFSEDRISSSSSSSSSSCSSESSHSKSEDRNSSTSSSDSSSDSSDSSSSDSSSSTSSRSIPSSTHKDENIPNSTKQHPATPTLQPYASKMERFELFSTGQCYYLIGSDKHATVFRLIKMDRSRIEYPSSSRKDFQGQARSQESDRSENTNPGPYSQESVDNRKIRRLPEFCVEDPTIYTAEEIRNMLDMIRDGDQSQRPHDVTEGSAPAKIGGDLEPIVRAHGIVGFIRFLDCYYLTLITKKVKVGCIGGNIIYTIKDTETIPIKPADYSRSTSSVLDGANSNDPQSMLLNMWNRGKRSLNMGLTPKEAAELRYQLIYQSVDLAKDFFFSYTYDLTQSLQYNMLTMTSRAYPPPPFKSMYMWNYFQTRELEEVTGSMTSFHWIMPIIHGAFIQRKLQDYGRSLNLSLLARRSRHFAGTRYRKRGVSDAGKVANDVEHEQIIHDESPLGEGIFCSFIQVRGSIPTYWTQESSVTMPKPPIVLNRVDPTYQATQLHFEDLFKRYGSPIVVVDLVKQSEKREREVIVGNEYRHAIEYLNQHIDENHKIRYCALDYSHISKHRNLNVSSSLHEVSTWAVNQTGFFCSSPRWKIIDKGVVVPFHESDDENESLTIKKHLGVPVFAMEQEGVLRTNCIDCLDRTNVAQFSAGVEALGQQLVVMGIRSAAKLNPSSSIVRLLIDMYVDVGDHIALQYGGSEAHKKVQVQNSGVDMKGDGAMGKHKELLTSIRRYYSNVLTDSLKQEAMNLFLGYYIPSMHTVPLWDLENDYYLHNFHVKSGTSSMRSMRMQHPCYCLFDDYRGGTADKDNKIDESVTHSVPKLRRNLSRRSLAEVKMEKGTKHNVESYKLQNIRKRCTAQHEALSLWWRNAIQAYVDQRCWMHIGENPFLDLLPSRFEREHGAQGKLYEFDKHFSRPYTRLVRLKQPVENRKVVDEELNSLLLYRKTVSSKDKTWSRSKESKHVLEDSANVTRHGEKNHEIREPYLKNFLSSKSLQTSHRLINDYAAKIEKYTAYCQTDNESLLTEVNRKRSMNEFSVYLHDVHLHSDDVPGILKLSQEAHIHNELLTGPFKGLSQHESASDVVTVITELLNRLESTEKKNLVANKHSITSRVVEDLKRREMDTPGVLNEIKEYSKIDTHAETCYDEILSNNSTFHERSDVTDNYSSSLYSSMFSEDVASNDYDVSSMDGNLEVKDLASNNDEIKQNVDAAKCPQLFRKARMIGIDIGTDLRSNNTSNSFRRHGNNEILHGFEQINDNLFARKDNRFLVFNDAGLSDWPPESKTRLGGIIEDVNLVRSAIEN